MSPALPVAAAAVLVLAGSSCATRPMSATSAGTAVVEPRKASPPRPPAAPEPTATEPSAPDPPPDAPAPKLLSDTDSSLGQEVQAKLGHARDLAAALDPRTLSIEQTDQLLGGQQFVGECTEAVAAGDLQRASVLVDKALVILEELEQSTRP